jgi:hypothetical protein
MSKGFLSGETQSKRQKMKDVLQVPDFRGFRVAYTP